MQIPLDQAMAALRPLLADPCVLKVLHNAKYDLEVLANPANGGLEVAPVDDSMMISYALEAGAHGHGLDELATLHLGHETISFDSVTGTGKARIPFALAPLERATAYAALERGYDLTLIGDAHIAKRLDTGNGTVVEADALVREFNSVLPWLSYPGRRNRMVPATELSFN